MRRHDLLNRCLQALMSQDFDPSMYEVIVVDDAADEATQALVMSWAERAEVYTFVPQPALSMTTGGYGGEIDYSTGTVKTGFVRIAGIPRLRYMPVLGNHGPAAARNCGWRAAEGEIIAFTDDDCIPAADWLSKGAGAFAEGVDGVSGRMVVPLPLQPTDYERDVAGLENSCFVTANCFYRRTVLEASGGFDERFRMAWREDSDLFFRMLDRESALLRASDAVVVHPVRPAPWGASLSQQRKNFFNALVYKKHPQRYREWLQASPPWQYYLSTASLLVAPTAGLSGQRGIVLAALALWLLLTIRFLVRRLRGTTRSLSHIVEMVVTSILIPPLAIYWRLRGAIEFKVLFL
jgi:glycosyltransferase involved in cell wall biosynthesis